MDRYGRTVPPYRETRDYVKKVGLKAGRHACSIAAGGKLVVYKWIEIVDGRALPTVLHRAAASGSYEIVRP